MTVNTVAQRMSPLRVARLARELTQQELSAIAGVSVRAIIRLEAGTHRPHEATRRALATALGRRPMKLFPPTHDEAPGINGDLAKPSGAGARHEE